jgi:profilin
MSWDSYIDNLIGQCNGMADKACIIGLEGGAAWTTAEKETAIALQGNEGPTLANALKNRDSSNLAANGIYVEGMKYQFLRMDENVIFGKMKDNGSLTIQASKTAIVIGHTKEGGTQGDTNKGVAVIAEYLESLGM